jgi:hypothetical protein
VTRSESIKPSQGANLVRFALFIGGLKVRLIEAIARSVGNKALATNDRGHTIIVQECYVGFDQWWFHLWCIQHGEVYETDFMKSKVSTIQGIYDVDFTADYWISI